MKSQDHTGSGDGKNHGLQKYRCSGGFRIFFRGG